LERISDENTPVEQQEESIEMPKIEPEEPVQEAPLEENIIEIPARENIEEPTEPAEQEVSEPENNAKENVDEPIVDVERLPIEIQDAAGTACSMEGYSYYSQYCYENTSYIDDSCIDTSGNNAIGTEDYCHGKTECSSHIGASCQVWNNPSSYNGLCVIEAGLGDCYYMSAVSGEYGTGLSGGSAANFHSGNENGSCDSMGYNNELKLCSTTGGLDPSANGLCLGGMCTSNSAYLNCNQGGSPGVCSVSDVSGSTSVHTTCGSSEKGWACDSMADSTGFSQDGICADMSTSCVTTGYICNSSTFSLYSSACGTSCYSGNPCDATLTDGNFNNTYGYCSGTNCIAGKWDGMTNCSMGTGSQCSTETMGLQNTCIDTSNDLVLNNSDYCLVSANNCSSFLGRACDYYNNPSTYMGVCVVDAGIYGCSTANVVSGEYGT